MRAATEYCPRCQAVTHTIARPHCGYTEFVCGGCGAWVDVLYDDDDWGPVDASEESEVHQSLFPKATP